MVRIRISCLSRARAGRGIGDIGEAGPPQKHLPFVEAEKLRKAVIRNTGREIGARTNAERLDGRADLKQRAIEAMASCDLTRDNVGENDKNSPIPLGSVVTSRQAAQILLRQKNCPVQLGPVACRRARRLLT